METRVLLGRLSIALEALDRNRQVDRQQHESRFRSEQYVKRELLLLERRTPPYDPGRFPEREKLQRQLADLEKERRSQLREVLDREHALHAELLTLLSQHEALTPTDSWKPSSANSGRSVRKK
ncbi:MAG: hypothetical protein AB7I09_11630 [Planctomycetota bacterium]